MKKLLIVLGLVIGSAGVASANCGDAIFDSSPVPVQIGTVNCGNGDPMAVGMAWGLTGSQTPKIAAGASGVDEAGNSYTCPAWYNLGMGGCFDVPKTSYYGVQMRANARILQGIGALYQFPHLTYWAR